MTIESFAVGPMDSNVYVVADDATGDAAVIDPGIESDRVLEHVRERQWRLAYVINTHGHFDHVFQDVRFVEQTGAELLIHAEDAPLLKALSHQASWFGLPAPPTPVPTRLLRDGDAIAIGRLVFRVLHTPGHTPGGICLLGHGVLLSGDTLFAGSVGRTDFVGGDCRALTRAIREKLLPLPDDTVVYPGHGPATTIGQERAGNPFLMGM